MNSRSRSWFQLLVLAVGATATVFTVAEARDVAVTDRPLSDDRVCQGAIQSAEQTYHLPLQLLSAISITESGRIVPQTGHIAAWPWTINVGGAGYFYDTKEQAVAAVKGYQAKGIQSIDVGCLQVNLSFHPTAFASLDQAFDPVTNVTYAAGFLTRLFAQSHSWAMAAAAYHSQTPGLSDGYIRRVVAAWPLAVRYIEAATLATIMTPSGLLSQTIPAHPSQTCPQRDLSRYTPEFKKVIVQASLDRARILSVMGFSRRVTSAENCGLQEPTSQTPLRSAKLRQSQSG